MDRGHWIVSDPPHNDVDLDAASRLLGLGKAEARLKINFWAPEVWLAFADDDQASTGASDLEAAGLNVRVIAAKGLLTVPPPKSAQSVLFTDDHLAAQTEDGEVRLGYDVPVIGSFCKPPADFSTGDSAPRPTRGSSRSALGRQSSGGFIDGLVGLGGTQATVDTVEMLERRPNLDLYFTDDAGVRRIAITQGVSDISGLDDAQPRRPGDELDVFVAECEQRFADLVLDKRLVNVRPRRRLMVGDPSPGAENRKLFSFGTVGLQALLESVSPEFAHITQFELGSRLAYLMCRAAHPAWGSQG